MRTDQIHTMRQTHRSLTTVMPLVTAGLTIAGVVLANMERQAGRQERQDAQQPQTAYPYAISPRVTRVVPVVSPVAAPQVIYRPRRLTILGYVGTLLSRVLMVLIGMVAVAAIVGLYFASDPTWRAIELTALILLILYLVERVARSRRA